MEYIFLVIVFVWFVICLSKLRRNRNEQNFSSNKKRSYDLFPQEDVEFSESNRSDNRQKPLDKINNLATTVNNKLDNSQNLLEKLNKQIAIAKKSDEIQEALNNRFGFPCVVERLLLSEIEYYKKMGEFDLDSKKANILSAEAKEYITKISDKSKKIYEPREKDQRAVDFLTSYQPWPFDLSPKNFEIYRKAIVGFGSKRENYDFTKKFPRDISEKYFQKDLRLAKLFSENTNDYYGTFLGYADAIKKGEDVAIKYDIQVRLLRFVTSKDLSFTPEDIVCHCATLNKMHRLNIADDWFIKKIIANGYDSYRWENVYHWLEAYVDIDSLRETLEWAELKKIRENVRRLLAIADSLEVNDSIDIETYNNRVRRAKIKEFINSNHIRALYHFTAASNLESIRKSGGLFSWKYLQTHGLSYEGGGNEDSKFLDMKKHLENYVRLSFCRDHPMSFHVRNRIKGALVLLEIDPSILFEEGVLVSDINAADNCAKIQEVSQGLQSINFQATQRTYVGREDPDFKPHQAEILVPETVPLKFIQNLN